MPGQDNFNVDGELLIVSVNPKLYPLEAVYSAAYVFMDRAYIVLDGDPGTEILVKMKLKSEGSLQKLAGDFNNELLNYAEYLARSKETKKIRETLLQRALFANDPSYVQQKIKEDSDFDDLDDLDDLDDDYLDDPEGIAVPWEEKYGGKCSEKVCQDETDKAKQ